MPVTQHHAKASRPEDASIRPHSKHSIVGCPYWTHAPRPRLLPFFMHPIVARAITLDRLKRIQFSLFVTSPQKRRLLIALLATIAVIAGAVYLYRVRRSASPATAALAPNILSLLPPHAPAIAYVDAAALRRLQNSPLAAILGLTQEGPQPDLDYQNFVRDTGFDYARDLDKAAIALWP